ncbi:MAG: hypothetical protein U9N45_05265, partial [Gemmatimonadota bacterium]|nr:hypothetical protein [Gemmatimonadota bacterium]
MRPARGESAGAHSLYEKELGKAVEMLFAMNLDESERIISGWIERQPDRPEGYFLLSAALSWRIYLQPEEADIKHLNKEFEEAVEKSRRAAEKARSRKESRFEGTLYLGAAYGLEALVALLDHRYLVMAPLAKQAWNYLEEAVELDPGYYDIYFGLGNYRYLIDMLPETAKMLAFLYGFEGD